MLAPRVFAFGGVEEVRESGDNIEEAEEVEALRLFRLRLCWLWVNVNSEGSNSESTSLPATLALSLRSLRSRLVRRSGGVRGVKE